MFDIGSRIIQLRELHSLSANKLSKELGVDPSTINKIEKGTAKPSIDLLYNICNYFDITPSDFFANAQEVELLPPEVNQICAKVKELPLDKLKVLNAVLDSWD